MYAKSGNEQEKQSLIDHLVVTMKLAKCCAQELGLTQELVEMIELASFCHDVGKCTDYFQQITLASDEIKENLKEEKYPKLKDKFPPRHNEISWLYCALRAKDNFASETLQAIYWHHGTFLYRDEVVKRDINNVWDELKNFEKPEEVFQKIDILLEHGKKYLSFNIEKYFDSLNEDKNTNIQKIFENPRDISLDIKNARRLLIRSCVIRADHIASSLSCDNLKDIIENDNAQQYFDKLSLSYEKIDVNCPEIYNKDRFQIQQNCVNDCKSSVTTVVKAPAGFGKTMIGLVWALQKNKQIFWVCPRNSVAEGVYKNIVEELKALDLINDVSVELFLTSERKYCTHDSLPSCTSRIIVTNIDNLLSPMVAYKDVKRLFDINSSFVILDEFHEYLNLEEDEALFAAFITYMRARNLCCKNVQTLLLSATPTILHELWDGNNNKTKLLPNETDHYPAQHQEKYQFIFGEETVVDPKMGSLTMYLAIKDVQKHYFSGYTQICHSKYTKDDRKKTFDYLLNKFGKNGDKKETVISAPILQAALDISFNKLYKSSESPESDIQTIGRINRWGEIHDICNLHMLNLCTKENPSEKCALQNRYNVNLFNEWYRFLQENTKENSLLTLDEIYKIYNKFNTLYKVEINAFVKEKLEESFKKLCDFYPKQTSFKKKNLDDNKTYTAKTLRSSTKSYFVLVQDTNGNWTNATFTISDQDLEQSFLTERTTDFLNNKSKLIKRLETLSVDFKETLDYSEVIKNLNKKKVNILQVLKRFANCSASPIPVLSHEYNNIIGLIERK